MKQENSATPLVSVVTPFHNTRQHLAECIESVLSQSHEHFEYILQDNASNDGSTEIALSYVKSDARIRYLRIDNLLPQVTNYNLALSRIDPASTYCKIVQADDWISSDCLEKMVSAAQQSPRIGLVSAYRLKGRSLAGDGLPYTNTHMSGRDIARLHLLSGHFLFGSPTTVMYRSEVVRGRQPFFEEGRLNDDTDACYQILQDWDFGFVHQVLSFTRVDPDSIMGRRLDKDPGVLDRLICTRRYGPRFLDQDEYLACEREAERRYYRRLARAALMCRDAEYWRFHRDGLATQPPPLDWRRVLRAIVPETVAIVTSPRTALDVLRAWRDALFR